MPPHHAPQHEPELGLRELGCPYAADDPKARAWLAGYKAGYNGCYEATNRIREEVFGK